MGQVENIIRVRVEYGIKREYKRGNSLEPLRLDCYFTCIALWMTEPFNT